jgi:hypothetical protein
MIAGLAERPVKTGRPIRFDARPLPLNIVINTNSSV